MTSAPLHKPTRLAVTFDSSDVFDVRQFAVHARMSSLFTIQIVAVSANENIDFDAIVGLPAAFTVRYGYRERRWSGICGQAQQVRAIDGREGLSTYHLTLVPTLWLAGSHDAVVPVKRQAEEAAKARHCDYIEIPGAGHLLPLEHPSAVAGALATWMVRTP